MAKVNLTIRFLIILFLYGISTIFSEDIKKEIENGQCYGQFVDAKKDKCEVNNGDHLDENEDNRKEKDENPDTTILLDRVKTEPQSPEIIILTRKR
jgi:hypothetical protein